MGNYEYYLLNCATKEDRIKYYETVEEAISDFGIVYPKYKELLTNYKFMAIGIQDKRIIKTEGICFDLCQANNQGVYLIHDYKNHADINEVINAIKQVVDKLEIKNSFYNNGNDYNLLIPINYNYKNDSYCNNKNLRLSSPYTNTSALKELLCDNGNLIGWKTLSELNSLNEYPYVTMVNVNYVDDDWGQSQMDIDIRDYILLLEKSKQKCHIWLTNGFPIGMKYKTNNIDGVHICDCSTDEIDEVISTTKNLWKNKYEYLSVVSPNCKEVIRWIELQ